MLSRSNYDDWVTQGIQYVVDIFILPLITSFTKQRCEGGVLVHS